MRPFQLPVLIFLCSTGLSIYAQSLNFKIKNQNGVNIYHYYPKAELVDILLKPWWNSLRKIINTNEYQTCEGKIQLVPNIYFTNKSNLYYAKFKKMFIRYGTQAYTAWKKEDVPMYLEPIGESPIDGLNLVKGRHSLSSPLPHLNLIHPFHTLDILISDFNGDINQYSAKISEIFNSLIDQYNASLDANENNESQVIPDYQCTSSISFVLTEKRTKEYGVGFDIQILHHWYNTQLDRIMMNQFSYQDIPLTDLVSGVINSTYIMTSLYENNGKITCSVYSNNKEKYQLEFTTQLREEKTNERNGLKGEELFEYIHKKHFHSDFYQFQLSVNGQNYELNEDAFSFSGLDKGGEGTRISKSWTINQDGKVPVNLYSLETKDDFFRTKPIILTEEERKAAEEVDHYVSRKEEFKPLSILVKDSSKKDSSFKEMNVTNCYLEF